MEQCVSYAYEEIKGREGIIHKGVFVKKDDFAKMDSEQTIVDTDER